MTERLYYDDPYRVRFSARVIDILEWDGQPAVLLDRSAFYPTGGGQPNDTGTLRAAGAVGEPGAPDSVPDDVSDNVP